MEDIQSNKMEIKSQINNYEVEFVDDIVEALRIEVKSDDVFIVDDNIFKIYGQKLFSSIKENRIIRIDASENQKSYKSIELLIDRLIKAKFKKNHRIIAVGGGITQDCAAFIASILYRGVKWLYIPTSLLAQGDSCIGSKTSINFGKYKNLVGGFYPPQKIFIDTVFLNSLEYKELQSGLGEMLHYFIVSGESDFNMFKENYVSSTNEKGPLLKILRRSLEIKKRYIEIDEFDQNERQVFNYGHSFGHAIESLTEYQIPHGIAVSFGMDIANYISVRMNLIDESTRRKIRELLELIWNGYSIKNLDVHLLMRALSKDKKNVGNKLGLILNEGIGSIKKHLITPDDEFKSWMYDYFLNEQ